jgi:hypothetical protein
MSKGARRATAKQKTVRENAAGEEGTKKRKGMQL